MQAEKKLAEKTLEAVQALALLANRKLHDLTTNELGFEIIRNVYELYSRKDNICTEESTLKFPFRIYADYNTEDEDAKIFLSKIFRAGDIIFGISAVLYQEDQDDNFSIEGLDHAIAYNPEEHGLAGPEARAYVNWAIKFISNLSSLYTIDVFISDAKNTLDHRGGAFGGIQAYIDEEGSIDKLIIISSQYDLATDIEVTCPYTREYMEKFIHEFCSEDVGYIKEYQSDAIDHETYEEEGEEEL